MYNAKLINYLNQANSYYTLLQEIGPQPDLDQQEQEQDEAYTLSSENQELNYA